MEVGLEGCLDMLRLFACCLFILTLEHTLPMPDIYIHPDSLLHQCKKVMSLLQHV